MSDLSKKILETEYPYIIAEIGANHNGDMELAERLIKAAKNAGADCVKFQLYEKNTLWTDEHLKELDCGKVSLENVDSFQTKDLGLNNIFDQVEKFSVNREMQIALFDICRQESIAYSSSVFIKEDVDFLIDQKVDFLKIASCDANNLEFIEYILSKDYPLVISLGMTTLAEADAIRAIIPKSMKDKVILLHCVSIYPPKNETINLKYIQTLRKALGLTIGFSDHTLGFSIPLAAVTLGARVIEKHFTLDKSLPGWDHKISATPEELSIIVSESEKIIQSMGTGILEISDDEIIKRGKFRRSATVNRSIRKGEILKKKDISYKRPGTGIGPDEIKYAIGRKFNRNKEANTTIYWKDLS